MNMRQVCWYSLSLLFILFVGVECKSLKISGKDKTADSGAGSPGDSGDGDSGDKKKELPIVNLAPGESPANDTRDYPIVDNESKDEVADNSQAAESSSNPANEVADDTGAGSGTGSSGVVTGTNTGTITANSTNTNVNTQITPSIYMYSYGAPANGDLGGRAGADALCGSSPARPTYCADINHVHAFLTVSSTDQITKTGLANDTAPSSLPITFINGGTLSPMRLHWEQMHTCRGFQECHGVFELESFVGSGILVGNVKSNCKGWTSNASKDASQMPIYAGGTKYVAKYLASDCSTSTIDTGDAAYPYEGKPKTLMCVCW